MRPEKEVRDIEQLPLSDPVFDPLFCTPQDIDGEQLEDGERTSLRSD